MSQGQIPTTPTAARLKTLVSYPQDDPTVSLRDTLGWDQHQEPTGVHVIYDPVSTAYDFSSTNYPYGRRLLINTSVSGASEYIDAFTEPRRTLGDKIVLARSNVYDELWTGGSDWHINRLFYVPRHRYYSNDPNADEKNAFINNEEYTVYPFPSSFSPGGVLYERRLNGTEGESFSFTDVNGFTFNDSLIFFSDGSVTWDENPAGMNSDSNNSLGTAQFTQFLNQVLGGHYPSKELPFVEDQIYYGNKDNIYSSPFISNALNPRRGLEMLLQFDAYPNIGFPNGIVAESQSNLQQFSLLVFDHKRQAHWGMTLNQLFAWIQAVGLGTGTAGSPAPNINVSMSLLTEPAFQSIAQSAGASSDIDGDGTVGVSDVLALLTAYGTTPEATPVTIPYDSTWLLHEGVALQSAAVNVANSPQPDFFNLAGNINNQYSPLVDFSNCGRIDLQGFNPLVEPGIANPSLGLTVIGLLRIISEQNLPANFTAIQAWNEPFNRAANLAYVLWAWAQSGGQSWNQLDLGLTVAEIQQYEEWIGFHGSEATTLNYGHINELVCTFEAFERLMGIWGEGNNVNVGRHIATEEFPTGEGQELFINSTFNYHFPDLTIVSEGVYPSDTYPSSELRYWGSEYMNPQSPDALIFGGGSDNDYGSPSQSAANQERLEIQVKGFVRGEPGCEASVLIGCFLDHPATGGSIAKPLVGFIGFVDLAVNPNINSTDGTVSKAFNLNLDTWLWSQSALDYGEPGILSSFPGTNVTNLVGYPASISGIDIGLTGTFQMATTLWAIPFFDSGVVEVVFTGVSYKMKASGGEQ
jgi:hypothetical protein